LEDGFFLKSAHLKGWEEMDEFMPTARNESITTGEHALRSPGSSVSFWSNRVANLQTSFSRSLRRSSLISANKVSIVLDWKPSEPQSWIPRLAFAKLLQLEALENHGMHTQLVVVGHNSSFNFWSECLPALDLKISTNLQELKRRELEQEKLFQENASFLEVSPTLWQEGLYFVQTHASSAAANFVGDISLPFLKVDTPPAFHEWKRLSELKDAMMIHPNCCRLPKIKVSQQMEPHSVVYLEEETPITPSQLVQIMDRPKWTRVVLVRDRPGTVLEYAKALQEERGYVIQAIHAASMGGATIPARYCLLAHDTGFEFIGAMHSPLAQWAAIANNVSDVVQLIQSSPVHKDVTYPGNDVRSRIHVRNLPIPLRSSTSTLLGTSERPISLVVQLISEKPLTQIVRAYAVKHVLWKKYSIVSEVVLRRQQQKWIKSANRIRKCFPEIAKLDYERGAFSDEFHIRRQQLRNMGLLDVFELTNVSQLDSVSSTLHDLKDFYAPPLRHLVPLNTEKLWPSVMTIPYIYVTQNFTNVHVDTDFRETFNVVFKADESAARECGSLDSPETLWKMLTSNS
jgi:hypothetical protein